jgi:hypothetical protein
MRNNSLWNNEKAINSINQTYEVDADLQTWNYRAVRLPHLGLNVM